MFDTIVVGTDDSRSAHRAVRMAGELAGPSGTTTVHVVTGYRPLGEHEIARIVRELPGEFHDAITSDRFATATVTGAEQLLRSLGVRSVGHAVAASGADAILDVADEVGADLIVVGSRGHGAGRRLMTGSVSTKVVHHAPCSVLVVDGSREP